MPNHQIYFAIISSKLPAIISDIRMPNGKRPFSNAGEVMMTSSSQNEGLRITYRTSPSKDLLKSQTMALLAMMRG